MTLVRTFALRCQGCGATCFDPRLPETRRFDAVDKFRRWTRRQGWRRLERRDLCPPCAADERVRARIAKLPRGLF